MIPARWKLELKEELEAADSVKGLKGVLLKKIRKKHPKYRSKIGFWNLRTEGEAHIGSLVTRVTREFESSSLDEVLPEKCERCGHKNVIKSRIIALGTVSAATNQGTKTHPVVERMLNGYICTE